MSTLPCIIFDWDNTLLCTSILIDGGYGLDSTEILPLFAGELMKLSAAVAAVLDVSLTKGQVYIITNGEEGWVQRSIHRFIPSMAPYLAKIKVISAIAAYKRLYPLAPPWMWKYHAMLSIVDPNIQQTVISFGDSMDERMAVLQLGTLMPKVTAKSVKLTSDPASVKIMCQQLYFIAENMQMMLTAPSLDAQLDIVTS